MGNDKPFIPSIPMMMLFAVWIELDLKYTQAITMAIKVMKREKLRYITEPPS